MCRKGIRRICNADNYPQDRGSAMNHSRPLNTVAAAAGYVTASLVTPRWTPSQEGPFCVSRTSCLKAGNRPLEPGIA